MNRVGMLSPDKQRQLNGFLGQLPEHVAARLAKAIEVDRLIGGNSLPHDEILRALRPQLRQAVEPGRLPMPQRYFCQPFEDLLSGEDLPLGKARGPKQKGRIARESVEPVWNWLGNELMPARHRELADAMRTAILEDYDAELSDLCVELWAEAAAVLKPALAGNHKKAAAAKILGGTAAVEDAVEMALLLGAAEDIEALKAQFPKPIGHLTPHDLALLRDTFDRWNARDAELALYVPLIMLGRLERPWEALRITAALSGKSNDVMISNTDLGIIGELLFSDLDICVSQIQSARPAAFDPEALRRNLAHFSELSSGMVKELGIRRDGKWGQRLAKDRAEISQIVENLLQRAPKEIFAAFTQAKIFGKGLKTLDFSHAPDAERASKARRYAHLISDSAPFAVAAAFSAKLKDAQEETANELRAYMEDLLRDYRAAAAEVRDNADAHLALALELCALVLGEKETALLRRRFKLT